MKLNHVLVRTRGLNAAKRFFTEVIGLEQGERPPFPFNGAWFYCEGKALIHVVEDHEESLGNGGSLAHVAIEGAEYEALLQRLQKAQARYSEKDVPLTGERQVFVSGPDGLMVEMLFPLGVVYDEGKPYDGIKSE